MGIPLCPNPSYAVIALVAPHHAMGQAVAILFAEKDHITALHPIRGHHGQDIPLVDKGPHASAVGCEAKALSGIRQSLRHRSEIHSAHVPSISSR